MPWEDPFPSHSIVTLPIRPKETGHCCETELVSLLLHHTAAPHRREARGVLQEWTETAFCFKQYSKGLLLQAGTLNCKQDGFCCCSRHSHRLPPQETAPLPVPDRSICSGGAHGQAVAVCIHLCISALILRAGNIPENTEMGP